MDRSQYALVFSDDCMRNENVLEYVKKQVQKHHLNCAIADSSKDAKLPGSSSTSMLITATFEWLAKEVYSLHLVNVQFICDISLL